MRCARCVLILCVLLLAIPSRGQQTAPSAQQGLSLLLQSLQAMVGTLSISDVTLAGTARRIAGSDDEVGTVVLKALSTGDARMDLSFSSGQLSEVIANSANVEIGQWTGPDGKAHAMSSHNLMTDSSWFFPPLTLNRWLSTSHYAVSFIGQESRNGQVVEHLSVSLSPSLLSPDGATTFEHLSQTEVYLDSASGLPAALTFNTHPDNNLLIDIPIEIRLSDYRSLNGAQVPFHVEKYLNNTLLLDFQFNEVTLNSGLSATEFQVQ